jgi:hypothetical protein
VERRAFDYADLDAAMATVEEAVRSARRTLNRLAGPGAAAGSDAPDASEGGGPEDARDDADASWVSPSDR